METVSFSKKKFQQKICAKFSKSFFQIAKIGIDLNKNENWKQKSKFRQFLENQIAIIPIKEYIMYTVLKT